MNFFWGCHEFFFACHEFFFWSPKMFSSAAKIASPAPQKHMTRPGKYSHPPPGKQHRRPDSAVKKFSKPVGTKRAPRSGGRLGRVPGVARCLNRFSPTSRRAPRAGGLGGMVAPAVSMKSSTTTKKIALASLALRF